MSCNSAAWDHAVHRGLSKPQFKDLFSLSFYQNKENLILIRPTGTGKTHLAIAFETKIEVLIFDDFGLRNYSYGEANIGAILYWFHPWESPLHKTVTGVNGNFILFYLFIILQITLSL